MIDDILWVSENKINIIHINAFKLFELKRLYKKINKKNIETKEEKGKRRFDADNKLRNILYNIFTKYGNKKYYVDLNLKGLTINTIHKNIDYINRIIKENLLWEFNYPLKIIIKNQSYIFKQIWKILAPRVTKTTRELIYLESSKKSYINELNVY